MYHIADLAKLTTATWVTAAHTLAHDEGSPCDL